MAVNQTEPVRRTDVLVAGAVLVYALVLTQVQRQLGEDGGIAPWAAPPGAAISLVSICLGVCPLASRRRYPVASLVLSTAGLAMTRLFHVPEFTATSVALFLTIQSAGRFADARWRTRVRALSVAVVAVLLTVTVIEEYRWYTEDTDLLPIEAYIQVTAAAILLNLAFIGSAWWYGDVDRARAEREQELALRTAELEVEREENARRAVLTERLRIAREIHDIVAHHVSVMGIQAGAARRVVTIDPAQAEMPLRAIEDASRDAVAELQRLLLFLRSEDAEAGGAGADRSPVPGMDQLPQLRRQLADAGLACSYTESGEVRALSPTVDLSAFRIIQESLTNVLKHAGVDRAELSVDYGPDRLTIGVTNVVRSAWARRLASSWNRNGHGAAESPVTDPGPPDAAPASGNGIRGMTERATLVGGTLSAGPDGANRFLVLAVLPYETMVVGR